MPDQRLDFWICGMKEFLTHPCRTSNPVLPLTTPVSTEPEPAFDFSHFLFAQEDTFETARSELKRGRKETHWMWFIFPQLDGLGSSATARRYAIRSLDEARAYLKHPVLGPRLLSCCGALLSIKGKSVSEILGSPDDTKLRSSMTLFALASDSELEFREVIERYFGGHQDQRTLELLNLSS